MQFGIRGTSVSNTTIRESFTRIQGQKDQFAAAIYENLFQREPRARELFAHTSMQRQYSSILATLAAIIAGMEQGEDFHSTLRKLGQRHRGYQIPPSVYPAMADAILDALARFDPEWTPALRTAWGEAIEQMASERDTEGRPL